MCFKFKCLPVMMMMMRWDKVIIYLGYLICLPVFSRERRDKLSINLSDVQQSMTNRN